MAKQRVVSRTITTSVCDVLCYNNITEKPEKYTATIPEKPSNISIKLIEKKYLDLFPDTYTPVKVLSIERKEAKYYIPESEFIKLAKNL